MMVKNVSVKSIKFGENSRDVARLKDVSELMASIKSSGLLQPVCVKKSGRSYELVFGNRRLTACKKLGMKTVPAIVFDTLSPKERTKLIVTENLQRQDVSAFEQGRLVNELREKHNMSNKEIAVSLGVSTVTVSALIDAFNHLPKEFRDVVKNKDSGKRQRVGTIGMGAARSVVNSLKADNISRAEANKILAAAKKDALGQEEVRRVVNLVANGETVPNALKDANSLVRVTCSVSLTKKDHSRLIKEFGSQKALTAHFRSTVLKNRTYGISKAL
jgi:ParB/RepB/Spo0J family partition protein